MSRNELRLIKSPCKSAQNMKWNRAEYSLLRKYKLLLQDTHKYPAQTIGQCGNSLILKRMNSLPEEWGGLIRTHGKYPIKRCNPSGTEFLPRKNSRCRADGRKLILRYPIAFPTRK